MPIPLWMLATGAAVAIGAADSGGTRATQAALMPPDRAKKKKGDPGIKTWGTEANSTDAYWNPQYLKSVGVKTFHFGVCFDDWSHDLAQMTKGGKAVEATVDVIIGILKVFYKNADILIKKSCVRFEFPLRRYEDANGARGWAFRCETSEAGDLDAIAPPFPIPPRDGYRRVWISYDYPNSSRTPSVVTGFWPSSEGGPVIQEMTYTGMLRALLRMAETTDEGELVGQLSVNDLKKAVQGNYRWFPAGRKKARAEYK